MIRHRLHQYGGARAMQIEVAALARQHGYSVRLEDRQGTRPGLDVVVVDAEGREAFRGHSAAAAKAWLARPR